MSFPCAPASSRCARGTIPVETVLPGGFQDFWAVSQHLGSSARLPRKPPFSPLSPLSCLGDRLRWAMETKALSLGSEVRRERQEAAQSPVLGVLLKGCFLAISNQSCSNLSRMTHWKDMGSPLHQQEGRGRAKVKGRRCGFQLQREQPGLCLLLRLQAGSFECPLSRVLTKGREWISGYQCLS